MDSWNAGSSSYIITDEPFIPDIVDDISDDDDYEELLLDEPSLSNFSSQHHHSFSRAAQNIQFDLEERMCFQSKEATVSPIKQYHIDQGFKFVVIESKIDRYVVRCSNYGNDCNWRLRASFSKVRQQWEIKKIEAPHTCLSTTLSQDHINFDSSEIAAIIVNSVKSNPSIPIKSLVAEIKNRYGYSVSYKKAWIAKQKALAMEFGDWEDSYNHLRKWLQAIQEVVPGTIVQCTGHPNVVDDVEDHSTYIFERVFWSFKPCIEGFKYCKPIVQVDGTFLTGKYHKTFLTAISQDGNRNIFPLAFAIVEGETKEALIWFFQLLGEHVTPQDNLCLITDRGRAILSALQSEEVRWEGDGLSSVYCIRHIASNFNKRFNNAELKQQLINMGTFFFSLLSLCPFNIYT